MSQPIASDWLPGSREENKGFVHFFFLLCPWLCSGSLGRRNLILPHVPTILHFFIDFYSPRNDSS